MVALGYPYLTKSPYLVSSAIMGTSVEKLEKQCSWTYSLEWMSLITSDTSLKHKDEEKVVISIYSEMKW